jgi:GT2 family glycosyltransferase
MNNCGRSFLARVWHITIRSVLLRAYNFIRGIYSRIPPRYRPFPKIIHFIVQPIPGSACFGSIEIWGWAVSRKGDISLVEIFLNEDLLGYATYGFPSPEVADYLGDSSKSHCSYSARFAVPSHLNNSPFHRVVVRVRDTKGNVSTREVMILTLEESYAQWIKNVEPNLIVDAPEHSNIEDVRISVLILPGSSFEAKLRSISSVKSQSWSKWELLLIDSNDVGEKLVLRRILHQDNRVHLYEIDGDIYDQAQRILSGATGDYVLPLIPGTILASHALAVLAGVIIKSNADMIYSDHDHIDLKGLRSSPFFKPGWSPEYLRGTLYIGPAFCVRRHLALEIGGFANQDDVLYLHDFLLRLSENVRAVHHEPQMLFHLTAPYSPPDDLLIQSVNKHLVRLNIAGNARSGRNPGRIIFDPEPMLSEPLVSIIIPTRDAPDHLDRCLGSVFNLSSYRNFEVILIDNETNDPDALEIMKRYKVKRVLFPGKFNYSRANNIGVMHSKGDYILLLNNDTEVIEPDWIQHLLFYACQPDIGAVGGLLVYPNKTVQHAGVVIGMNEVANHVMRGFAASDDGYFGSLSCAREVSAVTAACLMTRRSIYINIGGLNEQFRTHFQDVDLCLRIIASGFRIIYTPRSLLLHYESATRGHEYDFADRDLILRIWGKIYDRVDLYYNPHFDLRCSNYSLKIQ